MVPTMGLMKKSKIITRKVMPGVEQEIGQMAEIKLGGFMTESFQVMKAFGIDETTNAESEKILQEASAVAESSTNEMFPSVPSSSKEINSSKFF